MAVQWQWQDARLLRRGWHFTNVYEKYLPIYLNTTHIYMQDQPEQHQDKAPYSWCPICLFYTGTRAWNGQTGS